MKTFLRSTVLLAMCLIGAHANALAIIGFDDGTTPQTGTLTYDGEGGAAVGTNIIFDSILGTGTPANDGVALGCRDCLLNFLTGANTSEGGTIWNFLTGGSFTVTGTAFDGGGDIASGTLLTGQFAQTVASVGGGTTQLFAGIGLDTKHPDLVSFYGFPADQEFVFATTALALGACTQGVNASFSCGVSNADLNNIARVPVPATAMLFAIGAAGLVANRKKAT